VDSKAFPEHILKLNRVDFSWEAPPRTIQMALVQTGLRPTTQTLLMLVQTPLMPLQIPLMQSTSSIKPPAVTPTGSIVKFFSSTFHSSKLFAAMASNALHSGTGGHRSEQVHAYAETTKKT
jgi:hypothetical protein